MHIHLHIQNSYDAMPEEVTCQFYTNKNKPMPSSSNKKRSGGPHNYIDPRVLPCLHTFCKDCIGGLAKESEKLGLKTIKCPTCNEESSLPEKGVEGLPQDLNLEFRSQAWALIVKSKNPEKVKCMDCRKQSKEVKFCSDCCDFLCGRCAEHHESSWRTEDHKLVKASEVNQDSLKSLKSPELSYCKDPAHTTYALDFYCESCDSLLCQSCLLADHRDEKKHITQKLGRIASQHKQEMQSLLAPADDALQQLERTVQDSQQMEERTGSAEAELKLEIEEKFKALEKELKTRKAELLKEVSSIACQKKQCLTLQRESFTHFREQISRLVCKINQAAHSYRDHEVLSLQGLLQTQLKKQLEVYRGLSLHLNESSVIPHSLDMANITSAVRNLGQVSCGSSVENSIVSIHIPRAIQGKERQFFITTLDETDRVFDLAGEDVKVRLCHTESNTVIETNAEYKVEQKHYSASLVPQNVGEHKMMVTVRNRPVQGSPFRIWVREPRDWTQLPSSLNEYMSSSSLDSNYVYGLALHSNGHLFVTQNHYVRVIDLKTSTTVKKIGSNGSADSQFKDPYAIAIHGDYIYVADSYNHRIQKFSASGHDNYAHLSTFGREGSEDNQLKYPYGICVDPYGSVYVADSSNNRIAIFHSDGSFRTITHETIKCPTGVAFDPSGNLHVVSRDSNIVNIFNREGDLMLQPYGKGNLSSPWGIAIDEEGYSFIVEYNGTSSRLQVFDPDHKLMKTVSGFNYSEGVVIADDGSIFVGDGNNYRIRKC